MAERLDECESLVALCRDARVPFAVHENWRWQAPMRRVKELLARGAIGTPFRCRIDMVSGFDVFANQPSLRARRSSSSRTSACHLFDLARSWFGEARSVYCRTSQVHEGIAGEDVATAVFRDGDATVTVNMAYAGTPLRAGVFSRDAGVHRRGRGSNRGGPRCASSG
jgi:predicted dehydrogenase